MSDNELPAGWRIATDTEWFGGSVEIVYVVQCWGTWTTKRWLRKPVTYTGWKEVYSDHFEYRAKAWALDTIKAKEAAK